MGVEFRVEGCECLVQFVNSTSMIDASSDVRVAMITDNIDNTRYDLSSLSAYWVIRPSNILTQYWSTIVGELISLSLRYHFRLL